MVVLLWQLEGSKQNIYRQWCSNVRWSQRVRLVHSSRERHVLPPGEAQVCSSLQPQPAPPRPARLRWGRGHIPKLPLGKRWNNNKISIVIDSSKLGALCCDNGQTKMTCEMMKNLMRCRALGIPKKHCTGSMMRGRNMRVRTTIATTTSTTTTTTTTAPTTPSIDYEHLLKQPCSPTKDDLNCCTVRVKSIK